MTVQRSSPFTSVRHAKRRRWATAVRFASLGVTAVLILALASTLALWRYANTRLDRQEIPAIEANRDADAADAAPVAADESPATAPLTETLSVLLVGTDSREGLTEQQLLELGTEDVGTALTDTVMLVQLSPERDDPAVVSFPRDLRVVVPGEGVAKINAVHAIGGPDLLVRTVQDLTDVRIDHYVEVNIAGFLDLTDAIGGVEICLEEPMVDRYAGVDLPAGCQVLDGREASGFVRSRRVKDQFGPDNDFGRIARQQHFIRQAMDRITSADTLANPVRVKRLIDAVADAVTTDTDLGATEMLRLANSLASLSPDSLSTRVVPGYYSNETGYVHPDEDEAEALFAALRDGSPLPDVGLTAPAELTAGEIDVVVLNGAGTAGLAGEMASFLEARGFRVVSTGNAGTDSAPDFSYEETEVGYAAGDEAKARLVAEFLPGAELVELDEPPSIGDVVVTVGADWAEG